MKKKVRRQKVKVPVRTVSIREINQIFDPRIKTKSVNATLGKRAGIKFESFNKAILVCVTNLEQTTSK